MKHRTFVPGSWLLLLVVCAFGSPHAWAGSSDVLAEVQLRPSSKIEKAAGIWVDGQYLGYLSELKGSRKIMLLPGRHQVTARLTGYLDFETDIHVVAGEKREIRVAMRENLTATLPDRDEMSRIKLHVEPSRAAVFVNDRYVGHVDQFRGLRKSLGLQPGTYKIHITLPGYQPFDTEMTLLKQQSYVIKTTLKKGDAGEQPLLTRRPTEPPAEKVADAQ